MLQRDHSAILPTFIKLPFVIKIYILSIFEWPFYTGLLYTWHDQVVIALFNEIGAWLAEVRISITH